MQQIKKLVSMNTVFENVQKCLMVSKKYEIVRMIFNIVFFIS